MKWNTFCFRFLLEFLFFTIFFLFRFKLNVKIISKIDYSFIQTHWFSWQFIFKLNRIKNQSYEINSNRNSICMNQNNPVAIAIIVLIQFKNNCINSNKVFFFFFYKSINVIEFLFIVFLRIFLKCLTKWS